MWIASTNVAARCRTFPRRGRSRGSGFQGDSRFREPHDTLSSTSSIRYPDKVLDPPNGGRSNKVTGTRPDRPKGVADAEGGSG